MGKWTVPWRREKRGDEKQAPAPAVQLRQGERHPFRGMDGYTPLHKPEFGLYRSIREAIPVVDAAVWKLVRLAGGVSVRCGEAETEERVNEFLRTVPASTCLLMVMSWALLMVTLLYDSRIYSRGSLASAYIDGMSQSVGLRFSTW